MKNNTNPLNKTIKERQRKDKQKLIETLKELPIIQVACKKADISRDTYYRWRKEEQDFRRQGENAMEQGFEYINDLSESQILNLIKEGKLPAIALWLKHHHPRYGYKNQIYKPIARNEDLTAEEQTILMEALSLASGIKVKSQKHGRNKS